MIPPAQRSLVVRDDLVAIGRKACCKRSDIRDAGVLDREKPDDSTILGRIPEGKVSAKEHLISHLTLTRVGVGTVLPQAFEPVVAVPCAFRGISEDEDLTERSRSGDSALLLASIRSMNGATQHLVTDGKGEPWDLDWFHPEAIANSIRLLIAEFPARRADVESSEEFSENVANSFLRNSELE